MTLRLCESCWELLRPKSWHLSNDFLHISFVGAISMDLGLYVLMFFSFCWLDLSSSYCRDKSCIILCFWATKMIQFGQFETQILFLSFESDWTLLIISSSSPRDSSNWTNFVLRLWVWLIWFYFDHWLGPHVANFGAAFGWPWTDCEQSFASDT